MTIRKVQWIMLSSFLLLGGCIAPKAIFVHPKYHEIRPNLISILPVQDHRISKKGDLNNMASSIIYVITNYLTRINHYRYEVLSQSIADNPEQEITVQQIKNINKKLLYSLGKSSSRWVLIPVVTSVQSKFSYSLVVVHGYLYDKVKGVLIWESEGKIKAISDSLAAKVATNKMIETLPERR